MKPMAHNLDSTYSGEVRMAYQGRAPWHMLGQTLAANADVPAAMAAAHLDFAVATQPIFWQRPDGSYETIRDAQAVTRDDGRYLATVGSDYHVLQNRESFDVLQPLCESGQISIATAGAIDGGRRVWMLARMGQSVEVTPGDEVNGYFLVVTGHDGKASFSARLTPIRVVCQNTLNIATAAKTSELVRLRHTRTVTDRIKEAGRIVSAMSADLQRTGETFATLAARQMGPREIAAYIETVLPADPDGRISDTISQRRRDVAALVWRGKGAALAGAANGEANAWAAYNAVTEYFDHVRPAQAKSSGAREAANLSAVFGTNAAIKARALTAARQLVAV
jgi:phage/plasmid-like protein (TIGR03299 family)